MVNTKNIQKNSEQNTMITCQSIASKITNGDSHQWKITFYLSDNSVTSQIILFSLLALSLKYQHLWSRGIGLFFPFHSPLALFWVSSCFPFDVLRTYWITCIFWVRDVINCLRWLWTSAWACGGVWIKCENWSDTCFITNALLDFLLEFPSFMCSAVFLLSSISFCFDSSFTTFVSPALLILLYQRAYWTRHLSCLTQLPLCLPVRLGHWIGDNFRLANTHLCLPLFKCSLRWPTWTSARPSLSSGSEEQVEFYN